MFGQLQQLSQQLVNKQHMFQQSLEMQRQQSQAQMETLTNLGAVQVAKTTYDARDFETKTFTKMKRFKGDEKGLAGFRVEASRCFRQAAEDRYDQWISESDIEQGAAKENWFDMTIFNMQLLCDPVGLDARRRLNHKYHPRKSLRTIQLLERLLAPTKVGYADVVASMERLEQELRVVRRGFGDVVQNLRKSIHMVCTRTICPKIFRHLEKQRLTIDKFLLANVHGSGASPMDVDTPLPRPKEARKAAKEKKT